MKTNTTSDCATPKYYAGRPTKYREEFPAKLIEIMSKGRDVCAFCARIGIHKDTFYEWLKKYPEFSDAYKKAREAAQEWWQEEGIKGMWSGKKFNSGVFLLMMKNRFGWNEKKATYEPIGIPNYTGSLQQKINAIDALMKGGVISTDQHNQMMSTLNAEAHITQVDEHETRLAALEESGRLRAMGTSDE